MSTISSIVIVYVPRGARGFKRPAVVSKKPMAVNIGDIEENLSELIAKGLVKDVDGKILLSRELFGNVKIIGRGKVTHVYHVKGLEIPAWGIRGSPGMALAYATSDRGGCHKRAWPIAQELSGVVDRFSIEGKAELVKNQQDYHAFTDSLVGCDFVTGSIGKERFAKMLEYATGMDIPADNFSKIGERIWNLRRAVIIKYEGRSRETDCYLDNFYDVVWDDPHDSGTEDRMVVLKAYVDKKKFEALKDRYYQLAGWDVKTGWPTRKKLEELDLKDIADKLLTENK